MTTAPSFTFKEYCDLVIPLGSIDTTAANGQQWMTDLDTLFATLLSRSKEAIQSNDSVTLEQLQSLFTYVYPKPSPDGLSNTCVKKEPNDTLFNLAIQVYKVQEGEQFNSIDFLKSFDQTYRLKALNTLVQTIQHDYVNCEWLGVYRTVYNTPFLTHDGSYPVLVKEAYVGDFSRPDFPLTIEFAKSSSNSTVAMNGKVRIIQDVYKTTETVSKSDQMTTKTTDDEEAEPYYVCDVRVESEMCLPIYSRDGSQIIGIVDAEAWKVNFFTEENQQKLLYLCFLLGQYNLFQ